MFGAEVGDDLGDLGIAERVAKGRHLLAAIQNLVGDFVGGPLLVAADISESGAFFCAFEIGAVAVGATFIAKEDGAGEGIGFFFGRGGGLRCGQGGEDQECASSKKDCGAGQQVDHGDIFALHSG